MEKKNSVNNVLTGDITVTATRHRVDERGIPMPDWWDDSDTTQSSAIQNALTMKSWRGGAS